MIALDSSALIAIALNDAEADRCTEVLDNSDRILISAATLTEMLIVASRRGVADELEILIDGLDIEVIPLTVLRARAAAAVYGRWGRGVHPAALNFGDCFAYATAQEFGCPLLFVGEDFARTDVRRAQ